MEPKEKFTNPKDAIGNTKVSITKLPPVAIVQGALAMMDGAAKYGPYNWRDKNIVASIYVDAMLRHALAWFEGQEEASDSRIHHLGHAIGCCAILLDAQQNGNLYDDRPKSTTPEAFSKMLESVREKVKQINAKNEQQAQG